MVHAGCEVVALGERIPRVLVGAGAAALSNMDGILIFVRAPPLDRVQQRSQRAGDEVGEAGGAEEGAIGG